MVFLIDTFRVDKRAVLNVQQLIVMLQIDKNVCKNTII